MDGEVFLRKMEETEKYRIDLVKVECFGNGTVMFKLSLKIGGRNVFLKRYYKYEEYVLKRDAERISGTDFGRGFFCDYGKGNPIEEVSSGDADFGFWEREKEKGIWVLVGNHRENGRAFRYIIWDSGIIGKIRSISNH